MRNKFKKILFAFCASVPMFYGNAIAAPNTDIKIPTIEELSKSPAFSSFTVSPDGSHIAAIERKGENTNILIWDANNLSAPPTVLGTSVMKFAGVSFIKDGVLGVRAWQPYNIRFDGVTKTFISKYLITDLKGTKWVDPLPMPAPKSRTDSLEQALSSPDILDRLINDPEHVLIVNNFGANSGDVYKVNIKTGKAEIVQRRSSKTGGYGTDLQGNIRVRSRSDVDSTGHYITTEFKNLDGTWTEHFRSYSKDRNIQEIVGFSKDGNTAYLLSNVNRDKAAIFEYDVTNKKIGQLLFEHKFFDASGVDIQHKQGDHFGDIIGFMYSGPRPDEILIDPKAEALDVTIRKALKIQQGDLKLIDPATNDAATLKYDTNMYYEISSQSLDGKVAIVALSGVETPTSYYLLKNDSQLIKLTDSRPGLDSRAFGTKELVYYTARDGLAIPAFLHKPNPDIYGKGPYPTIIHPHGGPWARDELTWDWSNWTQMLTSRGYAVLQPQYRGSADGWGRKLWMSGDKEWGQKMQDDKDDGAKWLISQGIAKPDKIAMFGFSYGGYASMVASIRPNGIYQCAIAGAGVSNLKTIWAKFYRNQYFREAQAPTVDGLIPEQNVDKISIPILVYHGDRDQTVPIEQSIDFVNAAKKAGKPVKFVEIKDYAHGPAWTDDVRKQELQMIYDYLQNDCGPNGLK